MLAGVIGPSPILFGFFFFIHGPHGISECKCEPTKTHETKDTPSSFTNGGRSDRWKAHPCWSNTKSFHHLIRPSDEHYLTWETCRPHPQTINKAFKSRPWGLVDDQRWWINISYGFSFSCVWVGNRFPWTKGFAQRFSFGRHLDTRTRRKGGT